MIFTHSLTHPSCSLTAMDNDAPTPHPPPPPPIHRSGGVRVVGAVRGAGITQPAGTVSTGMLHATDWLPTLVSMASGRNWTEFIPPGEPPFALGDGLDAWDMLATGAPSPRDWLLFETHPPGASDRVHGDALQVGDWKILKYGTVMPAEEDGWFPPPGQAPTTVRYTLGCPYPPPPKPTADACRTKFCLFNVTGDPCEQHDVAGDHPDIVAALRARLAEFAATAVPQVAPDGSCDPVKVPMPGGGLAWQPCDAPGVRAGGAGARVLESAMSA